MTLRQGDLVIDCADHEAVVPFWVAALGWERHDVNDQYVSVAPPRAGTATGGAGGAGGAAGAGGPATAPAPLPLLFQKVPEPKTVKNRVHLDFRSDDRVAEVARLVGLGATEGPTRSLGDFTWTVMSDPEGNEFCVA